MITIIVDRLQLEHDCRLQPHIVTWDIHIPYVIFHGVNCRRFELADGRAVVDDLGIQLRLDVSHDNGGVWSMSLVLQVVATTLLATTLLRLAAGGILFPIAVVLASSFAVVHIV